MGTLLHLLSADVISRYLRQLGEDVISVTGSDAHGTPILIAAEEAGITPGEYAQDQHDIFLGILEEWDIRFDNYTTTTTDHHKVFVQEFYRDLRANGFIDSEVTEQHFCPNCQRFLADRFIIGICPRCDQEKARGDQCSNDECNIPLVPEDVISPKCFFCTGEPRRKSTRHYYFRLDKFERHIRGFLQSDLLISDRFRKEALAFVERGLKKRALTRDISWGIPASGVFKSVEDKVFYVWAEDVLGYISASAEYLAKQGRQWLDVWAEANTVYCLGKDNLFFHAIWFPALQLASSLDLQLPKVVAITDFLQFDGQGFSKSKGIGVWADDALEIAPAEYWRFYLIFTRPENKDSNVSLSDFESVVNKHLVNTVGNLIHRSVTLFHRLLDGRLEKQQVEDDRNQSFVADLTVYEQRLKSSVYEFSLRSTLERTIELAASINQHLEVTRPWKEGNQKVVRDTLYTVYLGLVRLSFWLDPVVPGISRSIRKQLGLAGSVCIEAVDFPVHIPKLTFFLDKVTLGKRQNIV